tara:strand:- start:173 stop:3571 length:3399 start_codon:yes stop_codon:yes gene_type:complete
MEYIGLKNDKLQEVRPADIDYELESPNSFFGAHANLVPMQGALMGPRLFYGAKFQNQALPVVGSEAPLVQSLMDGEDDRSFDDEMGSHAGAKFSSMTGTINRVSPDYMEIVNEAGDKEKISLYNNFLFNRKTSIHNKPLLKKGDPVKKGQLVAKSNYTDDKGTLALGLNARIGVVPYRGFSLDDSIAVSEAFAKRLSSDHMDSFSIDYNRGVKGGKGHHVGVFSSIKGQDYYNKEQLENIDDDGVIKQGVVLKKGDPIILATKPKAISSTSSQLGKLSNFMRNSRSDASEVWDEGAEGIVTDVVKTKNRVKVSVRSVKPSKVGDKIVFRSGQKGVISKIIPDEHMPRTVDGKSLEVLLNPLGIPSRVNNSIIYELLLGKIAKARGKAYKVPTFNKAGEKWFDYVKSELDQAGIAETEEVFDPELNVKLENPITVGNGYILKLHHTSGSKASARAQGAYDLNEQPLKGGDEMAKSKRLSGLEDHALLSAGAYGFLKDMSLVRGARNDEYWEKLRQGHNPNTPDTPFVWNKFVGLLNGAGYQARKVGKNGTLRLGPMTDAILEEHKPFVVKNGELVDLRNLEPTAGGLFDNAMLFSNRYGKIKLPFPVINPAFEESVRQILDVKEAELRDIISGKKELPDHLKARLGLLKKANEDLFQPDFTPEQLKEMGVYDQVYGDAESEASMDKWPEEWVREQDPLGWLQWYERYAGGRRTEDDVRQIKRWISFKARHGSQYRKNPTDRRRAALRNWAINVDNFDKQASQSVPSTGPEAIAAALATYSVNDIENEAVDILKSGKKSTRGRGVKLLRYVKGFRRNNLKPVDYIIRNVPVIPPKFRPFSVIGDAFVPGAANELYRDLFSVMDSYKEIKDTFGDDLSNDSKLNVYDSVKAVYGFGKPVLPKTRFRGVSGFLQQVIGNNSKHSFFQRRAVSKPVDFTSRGVIGVDPELDLDQIGVPKSMAFKIYSPYIQRELVRRGMSRHQALKSVVDEGSDALDALKEIVEDRPIVYSRAPAWHKYNVTAGYPKLIDGDTILINPLVTTGHNADFDGDTMNLHVPSIAEAVEDAKERLMPSKMLFSIKERNKVVPTPTQELILGLYTAQHRPAKAKHVFSNEEEVLKAIDQNKISLSDEVIIKS